MRQVPIRCRPRGRKPKYGPLWKDGKEVAPESPNAAPGGAEGGAAAGGGAVLVGVEEEDGAGPPHSMGFPPTRWLESPRIVVQCAPCASNGPKDLGFVTAGGYEPCDHDAFAVTTPRPAAEYIGDVATDRIVRFPDELTEMINM